jgi:hypothetical protein
MSSLLSFAYWRQRQAIPSPHRGVSPVPTITEALSSDTAASSLVGSDSNNHQENFVCIPKVVTPCTPEGLRPRRSLSELREEFFELSNHLDHQQQQKEPREKLDNVVVAEQAIVPTRRQERPAAMAEENKADIVECKTNEVKHVMVPKAFEAEDILPERQIPVWQKSSILPRFPTRSWSTQPSDNFQSSPLWSLPSSWRTIPSAASPNLVPGHARTAVGNLVALQQDHLVKQNALIPIPKQQHEIPNHAIIYSPQKQEESVETMYSPLYPKSTLSSNISCRSQKSLLESLGSGKDDMFSPSRMLTKLTYSVQSHHMDLSHALVEKPLNKTEELCRSLTMKPDEKPDHMYLPCRRHDLQPDVMERKACTLASTNTRGWAHDATNENKPFAHYATQNNEDAYSPLTWVSAKKPEAAFAETSNHYRESILAKSEASKANEYETEVILYNQQCGNSHSCDASMMLDPSRASTISRTISHDSAQDQILIQSLESDMQRIKSRNQQRSKEDLIVSVLERLQDNVQLVADVQSLIGTTEGMFDWFVPTPLDKEGLLTGFVEPTRDNIGEKIDLLLQELDSEAPMEEFFISFYSNGDISEYEEDYNDLREALSFCKILLQMAVPESEKEECSLQGTEDIGHWKLLPGLLEAIGVTRNPVETPRPRGGDSSLFSLPPDENSEAETPMTSNVSLGASTLTTLPTAHAITPNRKNTLQEKLKLQNGLHLRQAIQVFSTALQRMSDACEALHAAGQKVRDMLEATGRMKHSYFQLMAMNQQDIRSLVDAFEFELESDNSYVYQDTDDEDNAPSSLRAMVFARGTFDNVEATSMVHHVDSVQFDNHPPDADTSSMGISIANASTLETVDEEEGLFEYDDLRRQTESQDYDDEPEYREGPELVYTTQVVSPSGKTYFRLEV